MKRRQALQRVAMFMGTAVSAPTLIAVLQGCKNPTDSPAGSFALSTDNQSVLAELTDIIIPKTSTSSASEAGVPSFIETMLKDCYTAKQQESFLEGINKASELAKGDFKSLSDDDKFSLMKKLEELAKNEAETSKKAKVIDIESGIEKENEKEESVTPFFNILKELTVFGYFTSEKGAKENLNYVPIPGKFEGCITVGPDTKAYAL